MEIRKINKKALSSDGKHVISGVVYIPEGEVKGLFHVVHGMTEYIGRYEKFMLDMAQEGFIVFGYDHLGHGKSINDESELGFFAEKDGWDLVVRDMEKLIVPPALWPDSGLVGAALLTEQDERIILG